MGKKKTKSTPPTITTPTRIFEATLRSTGAVIKGSEITLTEAVARRTSGEDVVVCRPDLIVNRNLAQQIETNANTTVKRCPPHASAGPDALPHYQPDPRPPEGHTFYETPNRKAR